jgi:hypothetical protein
VEMGGGQLMPEVCCISEWLGEDWFCLSTDGESIWFSPGDEIPQKGESSPKIMLRVVWNLHGFHLINVSSQRVANFTLGIISVTCDRPYPKFLLLVKMTQGDILWFMLAMAHLIVPKRLLSFGSQVPTPSTSSSLLARSTPLRLLAFRATERCVPRKFIWRTWWTLVGYPGNVERSRSWEFGCSISRMDNPIATMYW